MELDTPKGLILYGDVGTGKSMLKDMLASSLPFASKKGFHYSTFMLDLYRRIHEIILRPESNSEGLQSEYCLLELAHDIMDSSTVLFLDEFQLPDRAAAKILKTV